MISSKLIVGVVIVVAPRARAVASLHHGLSEQPVSRGWQGQMQCGCEVGLSSEREDDQVDVSDQVNDRMPGRLGNPSTPP